MQSIKTIPELVSKIEKIVDKCNKEKIVFYSYKVKHLIEIYNGNDWKKFIKFSNDTYNKIQLYNGDNFDIWLICWNVKQKSNIHDHPENGCVQKVLQGSLIETKYIKINNNYYKFTNKLSNGDVKYICGKNGLHMLENINNIGAITLHIYSPPNYIPRIIKT